MFATRIRILIHSKCNEYARNDQGELADGSNEGQQVFTLVSSGWRTWARFGHPLREIIALSIRRRSNASGVTCTPIRARVLESDLHLSMREYASPIGVSGSRPVSWRIRCLSSDGSVALRLASNGGSVLATRCVLTTPYEKLVGLSPIVRRPGRREAQLHQPDA